MSEDSEVDISYATFSTIPPPSDKKWKKGSLTEDPPVTTSHATQQGFLPSHELIQLISLALTVAFHLII